MNTLRYRYYNRKGVIRVQWTLQKGKELLGGNAKTVDEAIKQAKKRSGLDELDIKKIYSKFENEW